MVNRVQDHIQARMVYFLMNIKVSNRSIYFCRHGESEWNVVRKIGGDTPLSPQGEKFGNKLAEFMSDENMLDIEVWSSELRRTRQTCEIAELSYVPWKGT